MSRSWSRCLLLVGIASAVPLSWKPLAQTSATLRVTAPKDLTSPLPASVTVSGAAGGSRICLTSIRRETASVSFAGKADFVADASGKVDTGTMKARHASYAGIDPLGIFWAVESRPALPGDPPPGEARVTAHMDGAVDASATARMSPNDADLVVSSPCPR